MLGLQALTLVYKLAYNTSLMLARAGNEQDWGHSQITTPDSGIQPRPSQRVSTASCVLPGATHSRFPGTPEDALGSAQDSLAHTTCRNVSACVALGLEGFTLPARAEAGSSLL